MEVIVVDNGSIVNEALLIQQRYPKVNAIRSNENLGFAGGNNLGIKAANGRFMYFINNDTLLSLQTSDVTPQTSFQPLIDCLISSDKIGMVCPKIRFAWGNHPIQYAGYTPLSSITLRNRAIGFGEEDHGQYDEAHPTPYAHGAAMMIKREALEQIGLMPDCYFLYYEELDWSMMLQKSGYDIWYEPACTIYHKESQSTGSDSPLKTYYITRNRFLFAKRNIKRPLRYITYCYLALIVGLRDVCLYIRRGRFDNIKAMLKGWRDFCISKYIN